MTDDIKKDRSPNYPKVTLEDAIDLAKRLHAKAGKAQIKPEVAVGALGYRGLNGAALGTLAALSQYGLIIRERGEGVAISPLAVKLIHPLNPVQEAESRLEAALNPKVFNDIFTGGHHDCSEDVLSNHLIQNAFTPDGAKRAANVYKANVEFANLNPSSIIKAPTEDTDIPGRQIHEMIHRPTPSAAIPTPQLGGVGAAISDLILQPKRKEYRTDLGSLTAFITIIGDTEPTPDDFAALMDFAEFQKTQAERKLGIKKDAAKGAHAESGTDKADT